MQTVVSLPQREVDHDNVMAATAFVSDHVVIFSMTKMMMTTTWGAGAGVGSRTSYLSNNRRHFPDPTPPDPRNLSRRTKLSRS